MGGWRAIGGQIDENVLASENGMTTTQQGLSVSSIAIFLDKLITENASLRAVGTATAAAPLRIPLLQRFDSAEVPPISLCDYMEHLRKYAHFDTTSLLIALIYIDRISSNDSTFFLTYRNVHRLLLTCTTVAEKYTNDKPYINAHYAVAGGVCFEELNRLEVIVLKALQWRLGVSQEEYDEIQEEVTRAFVHVLSASDTAERTLLKEAVIEKKRSHSESSMQASTISGSTISADSESVSDTISDSSSEVDFDIFAD